MTVVLIVLWVFAALWLLLLLSPAHRVGYAHTIDAGTSLTDPAEFPRLTVLIPARNEGKVLATTLPTICRQDYPNLSVILVNDQSNDDSAEVLEKLMGEHANLTVIAGRERPAGWCGKPWAVKQGADLANTPWLLCTDADILFHPSAVRQAMRLALGGDHLAPPLSGGERSGCFDMVSLFPSLIFSTEIEKIGMAGLMTIIGLMFPPGWANNPKSKVALAAGGFILVRREAYDKIGGHESVKGEIIEDVNLARRLKESGARLHSRLTRDLVATRMYEDVPDFWEGLSKNAYAGMEYQPRKFWVGQVFALLFVILPPVYVVWGIVLASKGGTARDDALAAAALTMYTAQCLVHRRSVRFLGLPWWHMFLMPLSAALYCAIAAHSYWQHHFGGGTRWKGRKYSKEVVGA